MNIKADLTNAHETAKNPASYRRESRFSGEYAYIDTVIHNGNAIVTARFYETDTTVYCCLWVHGAKAACRGYGKASGYGFHKASAAFAAAVEDAGIALSARVNGTGASGIEAAVYAIGDAITGGDGIVHHAHA